MNEWGLAFIYKGNTTVQSVLVNFAIKLYFSAFLVVFLCHYSSFSEKFKDSNKKKQKYKYRKVG